MHRIANPPFRNGRTGSSPVLSTKKDNMYCINEEKFETLDSAMDYAKALNEFVCIKGPEYEIVGVFGADSVEDGKCPDGSVYQWDKNSRIGRRKRST